MTRGAAGPGVGGQSRPEAGDQGRGLEGEEGGEAGDTGEVVTRPREQHLVPDLARHLRSKEDTMRESLSLMVIVQTHLIFADGDKVDHRKGHWHGRSRRMVVNPDLAKWNQVALVKYFIKGRHHAQHTCCRRSIPRRPE